jgi:phage I-like protein
VAGGKGGFGVVAEVARSCLERRVGVSQISAAESGCEGERLVLRGADVPGEAPGRVLIAPWGEVESTNGRFVVDEEAARAVVEAFAAHGTDVPIDYEHQSLGGVYASPTGQAPAAGWIRALAVVSSAEGVAGPGLWADVDWTEGARGKLAAREYRYLSPVVMVRKSDRRVVSLHSAALTNKPAIVGMRPIVNKEGVVGETQASGADTREAASGCAPGTSEGDGAVSESTVSESVCGVRGARVSAEVCSAGEARVSASVCSGGETPASEDVCSVVAPGGSEPCASVEGGELVTHVDGLRRELGLAEGASAQEVLVAAEGRLRAMSGESAGRAAEEKVAAAMRAGKLTARQREWALRLALKDPSGFDEWAAGAPAVVMLGRTEGPAGGTGGRSREAVIASARASYRGEPGLEHLTSEEAWVRAALRDVSFR